MTLRTALAAVAVALSAITATAQTIPPIIYDVETDFQQAQELKDQSFVQGANVALRYRLRSRGQSLSLTGLTARWDARESATSTNSIQAESVSTVTNVTPNYFDIRLNSDQTGTSVTNWLYSLVVLNGSDQYPIGAGRLDIPASAWTGASAILTSTTAAAYTDAAVETHAAIAATTNTLGHIIVGSGLTITEEGVLSASGGAGSQTLAQTLALGNTSGANHLIMSALGLDQSRGIGFSINDGFATTTYLIDSVVPGQLRYGGLRLAWHDDVTALQSATNSINATILQRLGTGADDGSGGTNNMDRLRVNTLQNNGGGNITVLNQIDMDGNDITQVGTMSIDFIDAYSVSEIGALAAINMGYHAISGDGMTLDYGLGVILDSSSDWALHVGNRALMAQTYEVLTWDADGIEVPEGFSITAFGETITNWPSGGGISSETATNIAETVMAAATTNDMPGIDWGSLGGSGGITPTNAFPGSTSALLTDDGTNYYFEPVVGVSAAVWGLAGNQTVPDNTLTRIGWNTVLDDMGGTNGMDLATGIWTAPQSGAYSIYSAVSFAAVPDGSRVYLSIDHGSGGLTNIIAIGDARVYRGSQTMRGQANAQRRKMLAAGDTISVRGLVDSDGSEACESAYSRLEIEYMGNP